MPSSPDSTIRELADKFVWTPERRIEEAIKRKQLLDYRIRKQKELIHKINSGKWKTKKLTVRQLEALAIIDLKHLQNQKQQVKQDLPNLMKKLKPVSN